METDLTKNHNIGGATFKGEFRFLGLSTFGPWSTTTIIIGSSKFQYVQLDPSNFLKHVNVIWSLIGVTVMVEFDNVAWFLSTWPINRWHGMHKNVWATSATLQLFTN